MQTHRSPDLPFYTVEEILGRKIMNNRVYYLVKWKDFPEEEATWEYSRSLPYIRPLIRNFNARARNEKERTNASRNLSLRLSLDDSLATQPPEPTSTRILCRRGTEISANQLRDFEAERSRPGQKQRGQISNEKQVKGHEDENSKIGPMGRGEVSQVNLGGQKVSFGLPESSSDEEEEKGVVDTKAAKPTCIARWFPSAKPSETNPKANSNSPVAVSSGKEGKASEAQPALRRMALLQKVDESRQKLQFYVEMENGTMGVLSGQQLMERYPKELLAFFERLILGGAVK